MTFLEYLACYNVKLLGPPPSLLQPAHALLQALMVQLNKTIKNSAALKKFTSLRPTLYNQTHWSGKFHVVDKFLKIRQPLLEMHHDALDHELQTGNFRNLIQKTKGMLEGINVDTKNLQACGIKLSTAQFLLNHLVNEIENKARADPRGQGSAKTWLVAN